MSELTQAVHNAPAMLSETLFSQLRGISIFSSLRDDELRCLNGFEELVLQSGDVLVKSGEVLQAFFILLEGEIRVTHTLPGGSDTEIKLMPAGTAFGEIALLTQIPNAGTFEAATVCHLVQLNEEGFWSLMTSYPGVRRAILDNLSIRVQKMQGFTIQQEKMATLGMLAAGLMHELNNPGAAARRAASLLRANLARIHELTAKFRKTEMTMEQKECLFAMQEHTLSAKPAVMSSLDQSDAEEALAEWMENANIENSWKMAPTMVAFGIKAEDLECARTVFPDPVLSDALSWLEAMVSSQQYVGTIEESITRMNELVMAVKSYAYEGKGQKQSIDVNQSIHATLLILGHKMREKEIVVVRDFAANLPPLQSDCRGVNQIWTNLLDNSIDAVGPHGKIEIKTWAEPSPTDPKRTDICIRIADDGAGIPSESQVHIFDTFFTTKPVGVGTGLGLGIVHRIVEQYGGNIRFASVPGDTEFIVRLPSSR